MKTSHLSTLRILRIAPCFLLAALTACSNPLPCPGEKGAPMDEQGNEVNSEHNPNNKPRLNTECYYGRGNNGKITLLTQKPQTGFWNSSLYRIDQQTPINTPIVSESTTISTAPMSSTAQVSAIQPSANPQSAAQIEPLITADNATPASVPAPSAAPDIAPLPNQPLYYRAGKVNGKCGRMNVYREAHLPPCPVPAPVAAPAPLPPQITYVQNNYPPVSVQTGVAPAQAAGAFLGGVGEDLIGAGAITYAIRYRPDRISNDSSSSSNQTANVNATAGASASASASALDAGNWFHHPSGHPPHKGCNTGPQPSGYASSSHHTNIKEDPMLGMLEK